MAVLRPTPCCCGGGALQIAVRDNGRLIVESTSTPLDMLGGTGVYDILLWNNSQLSYLDGVSELIATNQNATVVLTGGSINFIKSMQYTVTTGAAPHIQIRCQDGWSWINNDPMKGIQGNWLENGSPFRIQFINDNTFGFDPVWTNIKVIPEPATLLLIASGSLLLRRKII